MKKILISSSRTNKGRLYAEAFRNMFEEKYSETYQFIQLSDDDALNSLNLKGINVDYAVFILTFRESNNVAISYDTIENELFWADRKIGSNKYFVLLPNNVIAPQKAKNATSYRYFDEDILNNTNPSDQYSLTRLIMSSPASNVLSAIIKMEKENNMSEKGNTQNFYAPVGVVGENYGTVNNATAQFDKNEIDRIITQILEVANNQSNELKSEIEKKLVEFKQEIEKEVPDKGKIYSIIDWTQKITSIANFGINLGNLISKLFP